MELLRLFFALLLPWLMGVVWLRWWWQRPAAGAWALLLGYGFLLGLLATTTLMQLLDALRLPQSFGVLSTLLVGLTVVGIRQSRNVAWFNGGEGGFISPAWREQATWKKVLFVVLLIFIVVRLTGLGLEIYWRPLFPWDAWKVWAVKSRVWFELQRLVPFVDYATWINHPNQIYTVEGWYYPASVSLISTWAALGLGRWDTSLVNVPWLFCAMALGLAFYGQARAWGASPLTGLVFTYLLLSLPLLDAHVALAGYADLWLATTYGLAGMAFFQWVRTQEARQGLLALLLALLCATIKVEGAIWILTFLPALLVARASAKTALTVLAVVGGGLAIWLLMDGFILAIPGVGEVIMTPELIHIPLLGRFELLATVHWQPVIENFFVLGNWHLFWLLALALIAITMPRIFSQTTVMTCGIVILCGFALLFFLFFFTSAASWAADYTAINRLFMHMTPLLMFYLLILVHNGLQRPIAAAARAA